MVRLALRLFAMFVVALTRIADDLKEKMAAALTGFAGQPIGIEAVRSSPAPGIAEVQIENGPMIYATEDGDYFFLNGDLHQTSATGAINLDRGASCGDPQGAVGEWSR